MKNTNAIVSPSLPCVASHGPRNATFPIVGAVIGSAIFLVVGLFPSLVYGGAAGVQLASGLFGTSGALTSGLIVLGIVSAVTVVGALFVAFGAAAGASIGALTRASPAPRS